MVKQRKLIRTWLLALIVMLLAPTVLPAQVIRGVPFGGHRSVFAAPFFFPSSLGGTYSPYYGPNYGNYLYGSPMYFGSYSYSYAYASAPSYQPMTTGLLPLSTWTNLSTGGAGVYGSDAPRMRQGFYPYTGTSGGVPAAGYASGIVPAGGYRGSYATAPSPVYTPTGCAALVGGSLNFAPVAYAPASCASTALVAVGPPARVRVANHPGEVVAASLAGYAEGMEPRRAEVQVRLPSATAELWFDGVKMTKKGVSRRFFTHRLDPGSRYTYEVRARWLQGGRPREQVRNIYLRSGDVLEMDFTSPAVKK
jgi:uncharacterized protein (TIGR03000 family)